MTTREAKCDTVRPPLVRVPLHRRKARVPQRRRVPLRLEAYALPPEGLKYAEGGPIRVPPCFASLWKQFTHHFELSRSISSGGEWMSTLHMVTHSYDPPLFGAVRDEETALAMLRGLLQSWLRGVVNYSPHLEIRQVKALYNSPCLTLYVTYRWRARDGTPYEHAGTHVLPLGRFDPLAAHRLGAAPMATAAAAAAPESMEQT